MAWVYSPTADKRQKDSISKQFEPIVEELKKTFNRFSSLKNIIIALMFLANGEVISSISCKNTKSEKTGIKIFLMPG